MQDIYLIFFDLADKDSVAFGKGVWQPLRRQCFVSGKL
jgi:hypothetical protein